MIRKISSSEYLTRYDNMAAAERAEYESRVGDWLSVDGQALVKRCETFDARLQNVLQVSAGWNDAECQAFEDGAVLLSALVGQTDTWLPEMLYVKSAKRAVKLMFEALWNVDAGETSKKPQMTQKTTEEAIRTDKNADKGLTKDSVRMQAGEAKDNAYTVETGGAASVSPDAKPTDTTQVNPEIRQVSVELPVPVRPKHIDQYVHLLPEKTQEHAAQVKNLLRELDETRRKMDLLMEDPTAKDTDREAWAKKATGIDNSLRKIYTELDAEWAKLVKEGRVVVDDLGNARVVATPEDINGSGTSVSSVQTTPTPPNSGGEAAAEMTSEQKAKRRELRKWLVDTRRGNGDTREEHMKKWKDNFIEFLTLEGEAAFQDEKIMAAAEHYGIDLKGVRSQESGDSSQESGGKEDEAKSSDQSNQSNGLDESNPTDSDGKETTD